MKALQMNSPGAKRDTALDLLKWLAMLSMVLDHLRYVGWSANFFYVPGRLAFPWFCLAIAVNVLRSHDKPAHSKVQWGYLLWLVAFAVVSEVPYRLYMRQEADTLNVLPTLALGLLVAQGWLSAASSVRLLGIAALLIAVLFQQHLMFGVFGVLLPLSCVLALRQSLWFAILPGVVCLGSNAWRQIIDAAQWGDPISIGALLVCLSAPLMGIQLLRWRPAFAVWPMRRWAYAIYPLHFLLLMGGRYYLAA